MCYVFGMLFWLRFKLCLRKTAGICQLPILDNIFTLFNICGKKTSNDRNPTSCGYSCWCCCHDSQLGISCFLSTAYINSSWTRPFRRGTVSVAIHTTQYNMIYLMWRVKISHIENIYIIVSPDFKRHIKNMKLFCTITPPKYNIYFAF